MEILSILFAINYWKIDSELLLHLKSKVCPKYLLFNCLWKHFFASNSPQGPLNLTLLIIFKRLKLLNAKLEAWRCSKVLKFVLLENYFSRTFAKEFFWKKEYFPAKMWLFLIFGVVSGVIKGWKKVLLTTMVIISWDILDFTKLFRKLSGISGTFFDFTEF